MFTKTEKCYLSLTLAFLAAGSGIKAYRHAAVKLGPFQEVQAVQTAGNARVTAEAPEAVSVPETSTAPDSLSGVSISILDVGPGLRGGDASQSDGMSGSDSVGDSSNGSANPFSQGPASAKTSESHRAGRLSTSRTVSRSESRPTPKSEFNGKVDLNRAEAPELTQLPGIGVKTAQAIVEHRRIHGPYRDFRDLLKIKGIGEKKLEKLKSKLIL